MSKNVLNKIVGLQNKEEKVQEVTKELSLIAEELTVACYLEGVRQASIFAQKKRDNE